MRRADIGAGGVTIFAVLLAFGQHRSDARQAVDFIGLRRDNIRQILDGAAEVGDPHLKIFDMVHFSPSLLAAPIPIRYSKAQ